MLMMQTSLPLCIFVLLLGAANAQQPQQAGAVVRGQLLAPASAALSNAVLILNTADGQSRRTYVDSDGSFAFYDVPLGAHMLQPFHVSFVYPEIRLDVTKKHTRASLSHNGQTISASPLVIRPAAEAQYYEMRKPIDVWSFIKSPYGLMIMFSLFAIFVFPRMKVDPEEYREMQSALRGDTAAPQLGAGSGSGGNRIKDK